MGTPIKGSTFWILLGVWASVIVYVMNIADFTGFGVSGRAIH